MPAVTPEFVTMRTVLFLIAGKLDSLRRIPIQAGSPCAVAKRRVTIDFQKRLFISCSGAFCK